jgi:hypothetical protein
MRLIRGSAFVGKPLAALELTEGETREKGDEK